jgi:GxxExxY protein
MSRRDAESAEGRVDFLVDGRLVVELKSVDRLAPIHRAQMISYLKATGFVWV